MRVDSASVTLAASHQSSSRVEVSERLDAWVGRRQQAADERAPSRSVIVSDAARQALDLDKVLAAKPAGDEENKLDPKLEFLKALVEALTGERIDLVSSSDLATGPGPGGAAVAAAGGGATPDAGFGLEYDRTETRTETEALQFEAGGTIRTADGREIGFRLSLSMSRTETETSNFSLRAGNAVSKDPLVINFDGAGASLSSQRFRFDLMGDGQQVDMPTLGHGSGFLVLDALESGQVTSGRQLFGPNSGDGFADLARYDSDANGWIDEADPVFGRLGVWTPDAQGGGAVSSL
ncbi:VCBS repeat-containing protein, partial [Zoogloea sp.]|uniref:VCBS repeat-containing protein n=1 Tax=Zoogloea sp. TaxID=49181 RepID=UPI0014167768